jgi:hypothetical protein
MTDTFGRQIRPVLFVTWGVLLVTFFTGRYGLLPALLSAFLTYGVTVVALVVLVNRFRNRQKRAPSP